MKYRVEFKVFGEKVTYFKDVTAQNAIHARQSVRKDYPESMVTLVYPYQRQATFSARTA
jgi:hypothetical protein